MKKKSIFFFVFFIISLVSALCIPKIIILYKTAEQHSKTSDVSVSSQNSYSEKNISNPVYKNHPVNTSYYNSSNVVITIPEFINNMQCKEYIVQPGETLTSIARNYISTCPLNSSLKLIKEASKITNTDSLSAGTKIYIPETILKNGYIHIIKSGDTWDKLCRDYYPIYNINSITNLLIFINDLPDNNLPLGTEIYIPNINI